MSHATMTKLTDLAERIDELVARIGRAERRGDRRAAADYRLALADLESMRRRLIESN